MIATILVSIEPKKKMPKGMIRKAMLFDLTYFLFYFGIYTVLRLTQ